MEDEGDVLAGEHIVDIVGESFYRDALDELGRTGRKDFLAALVPDPANPYDRNAVKVVIEGRHVGHLSREMAEMLCSRISARHDRLGHCVVNARLGGGGSPDVNYGVKLWLPDPERF